MAVARKSPAKRMQPQPHGGAPRVGTVPRRRKTLPMIYDSSVSVFPQKTAFRLPAVEIDPLARLDLAACIPLLSVHAGCLLVFVTGWSPVALLTCWLAYLVRAFGISVGYHRYLSHRAFGTSRVFQFALCFVGGPSRRPSPLLRYRRGSTFPARPRLLLGPHGLAPATQVQ